MYKQLNLSYHYNHHHHLKSMDGVGRAGYFSLFVLIVSCDFNGFVDLLHGGIGCHAVCDCYIS